jgi:hypothetical protein
VAYSLPSVKGWILFGSNDFISYKEHRNKLYLERGGVGDFNAL